jgi:ASC-1-like (ASCH) protein
MEIHKKTWPEYFNLILNGEKSFDVRLADWECKVGDTLVLEEWDPTKSAYTGRKVVKQVTFVLKTKDMEASRVWTEEEIRSYGFQVIGLS